MRTTDNRKNSLWKLLLALLLAFLMTTGSGSSRFSLAARAAEDTAAEDETEIVEEKCAELELPLYKVERANHSLETEDPMEDLSNLQWIMEKVKEFIKG